MPTDHSQPVVKAAVYRLLAQLWGQEISYRLAESLDKPDVRKIWMTLGGGDPSQLTSQLDCLAEDYCRLFVGPVGHLPPIQSVWMAGELQSSMVGQFTEFVRICHYKSPWPGLLPDHLANELQLMAVMLEKATLEPAPANTDLARSLIEAFFNQHLTWTKRFLDRVQCVDTDGFYGNLASLTQSFLHEEATAYSAAMTDTSVAPTGPHS